MPFKSKATIWESAPMLRLLLPFVLGIFLYDRFSSRFSIPQNHYFLVLLLLSVVLVSFLFLVFKRKGNNKIIDFSLPVLLLMLSFVCCYQQDCRQTVSSFPNNADSSKPTLAVVSAQPMIKAKTTKYEIKFLQKEKEIRAFLYVYKNDAPIPIDFGDTILVPNNWQPIRNAGNPYEMDYATFCARKNIYWQQFAAQKQVLLYGKRDAKTVSFLEKTYRYCNENINQNIKDSSTKALLQAMLLGNEQDIDPNTRQAYSDTGIIHIVSISGAHVGIFFVFITLCFQFIKKPKYQWLKYLFSLVLVWFYVLLAGAPTPALRAAFMFSIVALGSIGKQQSNPLNYLCTAAFVMLLWQPMWLFTIGFQLSFVAVLSILIFYPHIVSFFAFEEKIGQKVKNKKLQKVLAFIPNAIAVSIAAEILIAPLVAYYFHSFPPMFLVANVFASLAMTAILILGILLLLLGKIVFINSFLAAIITLLSKAFHAIIFALQGFNSEMFKSIQLSLLDLFLLLLCIVSFAVFVLLHRHKAIWLSLSALFVFSLLSLQKSFEIAAQEKIVVYNNSSFAQIEKVRGNHFEVLRGSESPTFASKNAHIGFGVFAGEAQTEKSIQLLVNQKILILDSNSKNEKAFPINVLIIASLKRYADTKEIIDAYQPQQIVVANSVHKYQLATLVKEAATQRIKIHNTKTDGAFVFP